MGLRKLLGEEQELLEELEHWKFQLDIADNDDEDVQDSCRSVEKRLKDIQKKIIKRMEKDLERRKKNK